MKLSLNRHLNDKSLSFLIINAIYVSVLKMNLLSSNILDLDHNLCVNLDVFTKSSQILKEETVIENLIHYNNLYLMNLTNTNTIALLLQAAAASKKLIFLWHQKLDHLCQRQGLGSLYVVDCWWDRYRRKLLYIHGNSPDYERSIVPAYIR